MVHLRKRLELIRRDITFAEALSDEDNILHELTYPAKRVQFIVKLLDNDREIINIVAQHLNLEADTVTLAEVEYWRHGSFNMGIPIYIDREDHPSVMFRVPLPYKVGEENCPGNVDEKLRTEAATYIYIHNHCPQIPVPRLWGFGLRSGRSVSLIDSVFTTIAESISSYPSRTTLSIAIKFGRCSPQASIPATFY